jgi:hypothetical protein
MRKIPEIDMTDVMNEINALFTEYQNGLRDRTDFVKGRMPEMIDKVFALFDELHEIQMTNALERLMGDSYDQKLFNLLKGTPMNLPPNLILSMRDALSEVREISASTSIEHDRVVRMGKAVLSEIVDDNLGKILGMEMRRYIPQGLGVSKTMYHDSFLHTWNASTMLISREKYNELCRIHLALLDSLQT